MNLFCIFVNFVMFCCCFRETIYSDDACNVNVGDAMSAVVIKVTSSDAWYVDWVHVQYEADTANFTCGFYVQLGDAEMCQL